MYLSFQSARVPIQHYLAFESLITEFDAKASKTDKSFKWYSELEKAIEIPYAKMIDHLQNTNPNWIEDLTDVFLIDPKDFSDPTVLSIYERHELIKSTFATVMLGFVEPNFDEIVGYEAAFSALEKKKTLKKGLLTKVKAELPKWKKRRDDILKNIAGNVYGDFVKLREDYIVKLKSVEKRLHLIKDSSHSNGLTELETAQDNFWQALDKLSRDLSSFYNETIKCVSVLLDVKNLQLNRNQQGDKHEEIAKAMKSLYEELEKNK